MKFPLDGTISECLGYSTNCKEISLYLLDLEHVSAPRHFKGDASGDNDEVASPG